jgi:quercetin dioxygenase-like cupin family protein
MRRRIIVLGPLCALMVLTSAARWVGHAQTPTPAPGDSANYTGQTSRMGTEDMLMGRRRFEAGARSAWHTHPVGQLLFVEQGRMRVQRRGQPAKDLGPGESDYTGANIPHWHGATPDQFVVQASISFGGIGPWLEKVTDDEYLRR